MAKRKVLPENFREIVEGGDFQEFEEVFENCEIDARTERGKTTANAFSISELNTKQVRFLIENGLNMNADCGDGYPAIAFHADNKTILKLMLDYRANINCVVDVSKGSALFYAVRTSNIKAVKNLLELGASITARNSSFSKSYLLDEIFSNFDVENFVSDFAIAKLLLEAGAKPSKDTIELAKNVIESIEDYKEDIEKDEAKKITKTEKEFAMCFGLDIPERKTLEQIQSELPKIEVKSQNWWEQFDELWEALVPERGPSNTIQGEIIRIVGKISYEILDNNGETWDRELVKMTRALGNYFTIEADNAKEIAEEAIAISAKLSKRSQEKDILKLAELAVKWVVANPSQLLLTKVDYKR